jgi:hypothetical protein
MLRGRSFSLPWLKADYIVINVVFFISVTLIGFITFNISVFDPIKKALGDFNFSDLLYSRLNSGMETLDTNVILVNIGYLDRSGIAGQIRIIRKHEPRAIGFDGFFSVRKDSLADFRLKQQLSDGNIVMASYLTGKDELEAKFDVLEMSDPFFTGGATGYVNLGGSDRITSTVRYFSPSENFIGTTIEPLSVELVKRYNPEAYQRLKERRNAREHINYIGNRRTFICFDATEIFDSSADLSIIKDKIVLMGYMGETLSDTAVEDIYFTPMNRQLSGRSIPDMYGVVIHANIVNMIVTGNYINVMPDWLCIALSFILCYFYIYFITLFNYKRPMLFNITFPVILLLLNVLIIYFFFLLYKYFNYSINSGYFLAPILLFKTFQTYYERILLFLSRHIKINSVFIPKL